MTNDEIQKLAAGLADCGKELLRIADALTEKKVEAPAAEGQKDPEKKLSLEDVRRVAADKARQVRYGMSGSGQSILQGPADYD